MRSTILNLVSAIEPFDKMEEEHIAFTKDWIKSGAEIFRISKPDNPPIHLISYVQLVDPVAKKFLLVDHKKAELWLPAGGHVEIDEHPMQTSIRETKEELGIDAEFLYLDPVFLTVTETEGNVTKHLDVSLWYLLKGDASVPITFDPEEFHDIRWFLQSALPFERSDPHMKRFYQKISPFL